MVPDVVGITCIEEHAHSPLPECSQVVVSSKCECVYWHEPQVQCPVCDSIVAVFGIDTKDRLDMRLV